MALLSRSCGLGSFDACEVAQFHGLSTAYTRQNHPSGAGFRIKVDPTVIEKDRRQEEF